MASSFVIYIDEAGDEGFKFKPIGSSSEWFVLSAVIARKNSEPLIWESMKNTKLLLGRLANKPLHFRELSHNKRLAWAQQLLKAPIRSISILVHKPSLTERDTFKIKYQLYRYTCRLLVERCSWLCRDRLKKGVGDGTAEIIFSNRSAMSYDDLRNYLKLLRDDPSQKTSIVWDHINLAKLTAINHDRILDYRLRTVSPPPRYTPLQPMSGGIRSLATLVSYFPSPIIETRSFSITA